ncbi:MAG: hypothetical protein RLZZ387_275 [Chloroflexota bacterium]
MEHLITSAEQISAAWLDAALTRADALTAGGVERVEVQGERASWSHNARLKLSYRPGSAGELPESLFLKMVQDAVFGPSEVLLYTRDYAGLAGGPLVRCYDARYDKERRAYHLLLDDVSATHGNTWERAITPGIAEAIGDALAALHTHRWTPAQLAAIGERPAGEEDLDRYMDHIGRGLEPLLAIAGADIAPAWRPLLGEIFARHPALMRERLRDQRGICLVHGDVNPGNILAPLESAGQVYLVDRQPFDWSLTRWLGVSDLAYLMCTFWPEEQRRRLEQAALRAYHAGLARRGVADYGWEQLWRDYRLAAVQSVYVAVEWCVLEQDRERMRWLWTMQLRRAMAALEDLRCAELWR